MNQQSSLTQSMSAAQEQSAAERNAKRTFYRRNGVSIVLGGMYHNPDAMTELVYVNARIAAHFGILALDTRS